MCKWRRSGVWVDCSVEAIPKNSGRRRGFKPLDMISMIHPCGFGESFLMLCIVFLRLDVSPRNLENLPFFSGCCRLRLSVVLKNGVEVDQDGVLHTAIVEQDAVHHSLDSLDLVLGDWKGFIWWERVMGIFAVFL